MALRATRELDAAEFWGRTFGASIGERCHSQRRRGFVSRFVTLLAAMKRLRRSRSDLKGARIT
jgi:lactoylglutathione lyase